MADAADGSLASWVQAGGVGLFAAAVLWQLRDLKPVLKAVGETLGEVKSTLAALLERERARAERIAAQEALRKQLLSQQGAPVETQWESDETRPIEVSAPRRNTPPRGGTAGGGYGPGRPPRGGEG